jgi:chlorite dismutase
MAVDGRRQFVQFTFYKVDPAWRRLPERERQEGKEEFMAVVNEYSSRILVRPYSLFGIRGDVDFMLWKASYSLEDFQHMATALARTGLGKWVTVPYCYLSMTKRSVYVMHHRHEDQDGVRLRVKPGGAKYLFVYPFVKTRAWYSLPFEQRQRMMEEHIEIGHKYPTVKLNTTYSFGLDDQEFVLAFESDRPEDFVDLVMELRESQASSYTLRDTPIFTCISMDIRSVLEGLGG